MERGSRGRVKQATLMQPLSDECSIRSLRERGDRTEGVVGNSSETKDLEIFFLDDCS